MRHKKIDWFMDGVVPVRTDVTQAEMIFVAVLVVFAVIAGAFIDAANVSIQTSRARLIASFAEHPITATFIAGVLIAFSVIAILIVWNLSLNIATSFREDYFD